MKRFGSSPEVHHNLDLAPNLPLHAGTVLDRLAIEAFEREDEVVVALQSCEIDFAEVA